MKKKFSILCCGRIAETMASTVEKMEEAELYAVAARDLGRAKAFAEKHGFQKYYGSYEELAADGGSDLVYVASPHSHHEKLVKLCLEHGRNVLCEKPLTVNKGKAEGLFQMAKSRGLFLMEAMWTRFLPSIRKMRDLLDGGVIGEPVSLVASFGGNVQEDPRLNSPELAGGALLDTGVYLLTMAELVFGKEAEQIVSSVVKTEQGVDGLSTVIMKFPGGKQATLVDSIVCPLDNRAIIYGEAGYLELENFYRCQKISVGEIENPSGVGTVGNAKCGDIMRMYLDIDDNGIIQEAKFKTFGCGAAVATSSMATELVKGKTIQEALQVTNKAVMEALDGLPPVKVHCSLLAEEAIHASNT